MLISSKRILHFDQNKKATSPPQSLFRILSIYPLCPIQPRQCRFLYCNLCMGSCEIFFKTSSVSMHSMLNLGGLGHAPGKFLKIGAVRLHLEQLLCDMVDKLFSVKISFLLNSYQ